MLSEFDFAALFLTLKLASISTLILMIIGTPIAWWLANSNAKFKTLIEAFIALPLILPPTVLGFYLLISMGPYGFLGKSMLWLGKEPLAFTFTGLVIGSVIYSMPFVIQPLQNAFIAIGKRPMEVAATLNAKPIDRFLSIALPLSKNSFITAAVLGFAHTVGEFGVVLMIGGNIPKETQVLSMVIYENVESLQYANAHILSASLLIISFVMLFTIYSLNNNFSLLKNNRL